jgi:cell division septum initiation protein DivIVA
VLAGKYLDPGANPYLQKYTAQLGDQFQRQLGRSLSQVSSPFMSGATLGATGIHGAARAQHGAESMNDFQTGINKIYVDEYGRERGMQGQVSQDIGQRTMNMRDQASRNYGSDQQFRGQIQSAKIQAQSALQQAKMAQALGYDQLASDMMIQYEQLNQQATKMEQDWLLNSGQLGAGIIGQFSEQEQLSQGPQQSVGGSALQGAIGGALGGIGAVGRDNLYFGNRVGAG